MQQKTRKYFTLPASFFTVEGNLHDAITASPEEHPDLLNEFLEVNQGQVEQHFSAGLKVALEHDCFHAIVSLINAGAKLIDKTFFDFVGVSSAIYHFKQPEARLKIINFIRLAINQGADVNYIHRSIYYRDPYGTTFGESTRMFPMTIRREHRDIAKLFIIKGAEIGEITDKFHFDFFSQSELFQATLSLRTAQQHLLRRESNDFQEAIKKAYTLCPDLVCDYITELLRLDPEEPYPLNIDNPLCYEQQKTLLAYVVTLHNSPELTKLRQLLTEPIFNQEAKQQLRQKASAELFSKCYALHKNYFCQYISALFNLNPGDENPYPLTLDDQFTVSQQQILLNHLLTLPKSEELKKICYELGERFYTEQKPGIAYHFFEKADEYAPAQNPSAQDWKNRCCLTVAGILFSPSEDTSQKEKGILKNAMLFSKLNIKLELAKKYFANPECISDIDKLEQAAFLFEEKDKPLPRGIINLAIAEFLFECTQHFNPLLSKKTFLQVAKSYIEKNKPALMEADKEATNSLAKKIEIKLSELSTSSNPQSSFNGNKVSAAVGSGSPEPKR